MRCGHCQVLHFACSECGHHQPINTLRPAAQRVLGRLRALGLALVVLFKLNYFGWLLVAWFILGSEWARAWQYAAAGRYSVSPTMLEAILVFACFALPFGAVSRMLLLRWRRAEFVGAVLIALVAGALLAGFVHGFYQMQYRVARGWEPGGPIQGFSRDHLMMLLLSVGMVGLGAIVAWPLWVGLVLPARAATALLDWQRGLSDGSTLSRG